MKRMTDAPELKPCPFCGGEAEWIIGGPGCAFISCKTCPAETGDGSIPRILEAWNTRAALSTTPPAPVTTYERELRKLLDCMQAVDDEAERADKPGAGTWSSAPVVAMSYARQEALRALAEQEGEL